MNLFRRIGRSYNRRMIFTLIGVLIVISSSIAFVSYTIAERALKDRSKIVLQNGVEQAIHLIQSEYDKVEAGTTKLEDSQEYIKTTLLGPLNSDGTRDLHRKIDLGDNGYFIIYSKDGYEVMHPTLEGQYVYDVVDVDDSFHFIVQEQIEVGINGGGYTYYSWNLPHSDKVGKKLAYVQYFEEWEWVVTATAYEVDFINEARSILFSILIIAFILILVTAVIVTKYIQVATKPVLDVASGMKNVINGEFEPLDIKSGNDETKTLVDGYNKMISSLEDAEHKIEQKNKRLSYLAYNDDLTKLPNRNAFKEHVEERLTQGIQRAYMVQIDILGLQFINSTLGYEQGDRLLGVMAKYLSGCANETCYISRTGSNEFSIWIEDITAENVSLLFEKLRSNSKDYLKQHGFNQIIDMYIAITHLEEDNKTFDTLYEEVSIAMKTAKENHSLAISAYSNTMKATIENELSMSIYLVKGIDNGEIIPYYQEKTDYTTGKVVGVEALARWFSSDIGFVPPNVFIPFLKHLNLMTKFSDYMIDRVLSDYQQLVDKYGKAVTVSINISPSFFIDRDFVAKIKAALAKHQVPFTSLILEITEDTFIGDFDKVSATIEELHSLGLKISIDDFGTGYSSLNYLMKVNPDEIKIDKSFVDQLLTDTNSFYLFNTLCEMATAFNYDIVAEGVESLEQLDKIKSTSLKIIQGYLYSKPGPL